MSMTQCTHLNQIGEVTARTPEGCEECLRSGSWWVHLRLCFTCGHVGCCDNSLSTHATVHFHQAQHPVMQPSEPNENWGWCYVDKLFVEPAPLQNPYDDPKFFDRGCAAAPCADQRSAVPAYRRVGDSSAATTCSSPPSGLRGLAPDAEESLTDFSTYVSACQPNVNA
jgi:Zn-finger in ubiquitin-hydrolases and other protein